MVAVVVVAVLIFYDIVITVIAMAILFCCLGICHYCGFHFCSWHGSCHHGGFFAIIVVIEADIVFVIGAFAIGFFFINHLESWHLLLDVNSCYSSCLSV